MLAIFRNDTPIAGIKYLPEQNVKVALLFKYEYSTVYTHIYRSGEQHHESDEETLHVASRMFGLCLWRYGNYLFIYTCQFLP